MTGTRLNVRTILGTMLAAGALLTAGACGGDDGSAPSPGGDSDPTETTEPGASETTDSAEKGTVAMSGQDFTEMQIMAEMYRQVLEGAGYTVDVNLVGTRDLYIKGLGNGQIDLVPEYLAGIADQLNGDKPFTTNDTQEALSAVEPLASDAGITMLEPSEATDQNAFFVTQDYAESNDVTALSDVAGVGDSVTLAAAPDCEGRGDCEGGLTEVYGIDIERILPTGFGTQQTKDAVLENEAQLGLSGTTDASLDELGLVLLEDDKGIQPAQNLTPAVNTEWFTDHSDVEEVLNDFSAQFTTEDLAELSLKVDVDRADPAEVATEYLTAKSLI